MSDDVTTFGGRIEARARQIRCPYCCVANGHCLSNSGTPTATHADRWAVAKQQLLDEGDGPIEVVDNAK
jgi:hypothetical protein